MPGPLEGTLVVELGQSPAVGFCGRLLAGLGATVVVVEPPGGAALRRARIVPDAPLPDREAAPQFVYLAGGKRSVVADLTLDADVERLAARLADADVVLDDTADGAHARLRYDALSGVNPGLVWTCITPAGRSGPRAGWRGENITILASGGQLSLTGEPGEPPLCTAGDQGHYQAALSAFGATCLALYAREHSGLGQLVDISSQEVIAGQLEGFGPSSRLYGIPTPRTGAKRYALMGIYPCADGYAGIFATGRQLAVLAGVLERPDILEQPSTQEDLLARSEQLEKIMRDFFASRTRQDVRAVAMETKLPMASVAEIGEVLDNPHLHARGFFDEVDAGGRRVRVPGAPVRMPSSPWRSGPPPALGELPIGDLGGVERRVTDTPATATTPVEAVPGSTPVHTHRPGRGPLEGIRVLDMTAYWLGPFCTKWLADFGADVIKVESPNRPDFVRTLSRTRTEERWWDRSAYFNNYNRGKRSLSVDPATARGQEVLLDLIEHCDVLVENYHSQYLASIGLPVERFLERKPDLVALSAPGYGRSGPDAGLAGIGTNMEQLSGIASLNRYAGNPQPYNSGIAYADPTGGTLAAGAVLLALLHRDRTGEGQHIELAGHEVLVSMIGEQFAAQGLGLRPVPKGNTHPDMCPHGVYPCEGDDRWVAVAMRDEAAWRNVCDLLGRQDMAALDVAGRLAVADEIDASMIAFTVTRSDDAAAASLQAVGVAAYPVRTPRELVDDPSLAVRGYYTSLLDPDLGRWPHDGIAWRLSRTPGFVAGPAPRFGQHTREVLSQVLQMSDADIDALFASGAAADAPTR